MPFCPGYPPNTLRALSFRPDLLTQNGDKKVEILLEVHR